MRIRKLLTMTAALGLVVGGALPTSPASADRRHGWEFADIAGFLPMTWPDSCPFVVQMTVSAGGHLPEGTHRPGRNNHPAAQRRPSVEVHEPRQWKVCHGERERFWEGHHQH
jgi:hypothetical protein